jgi:hypothetical protein
MQNQPPLPGEVITSDFLQEVSRLAGRDLTGPGMHTTPIGFSFSPEQPVDQIALGRLDESLAFDGTATVSVWSGAPGEEVDTGVNLSDVGEWILDDGDADIPADTWVVLGKSGGRWWVIHARVTSGLPLYTVILPGDLAAGDASLAGCNLTSLGDQDDETGKLVQNPRKCSGASGDEGVVLWNPVAGGGQFEFLTPYNGTDDSDQEVVTDWRFDSDTKKTQKKTRTLSGNWSGDESDWIDIDTTLRGEPFTA